MLYHHVIPQSNLRGHFVYPANQIVCAFMPTCIMYARVRACVLMCVFVTLSVCMCDTVRVYVCAPAYVVVVVVVVLVVGVLFFFIIFSFYRKKSLYDLTDTDAFGNAIGAFLAEGDRGMLFPF